MFYNHRSLARLTDFSESSISYIATVIDLQSAPYVKWKWSRGIQQKFLVFISRGASVTAVTSNLLKPTHPIKFRNLVSGLGKGAVKIPKKINPNGEICA